jgi:hypothetical protein
MSWDWLGGGVDFLTGGLTDFDNKGSSGYNWMPGTMGQQFNPIGGGSDNKWGPSTSTSTWSDALRLANEWNKGGGGFSGGGFSPGSFSYTGGNISNSPTTTSSTLGNDVFISQPNRIINLGPDNPEPPVSSSSGGGSSGGGSSALDTFSKGLGIIGTIAGICDIRVKTDISPLETTDITDDLAEVAFFVKGLRECS